MKKLKIAFLFLTLISCPVWSQQDPLSSQYMFNTMSFNPGIAGTSGMICATALNRQQWLGFKGAPSTTVFHVTAPISPFRIKSGVGLLLVSDNIGFDKDINISAAYSYLMDVGMGKLGIGINLGIINKALEPAWSIPTGDGFTQAAEDPLIPVNKESVIAFDAGIGAYYKTEKYYAALSVTHINQPKVKFTKDNSTAITYISRHYYLTGGYTFQLTNPSFELLPSVFAYSDGKIVQFNVTSLVRYNKKVWGGVSYRAGDALSGIVGFELYNGIRIGYSYDFPLSDIRKNTSGSHEFMVNYCFDLSLGKSPMRYKSIRFL
jgi:type IX secretion system PorP/SprF family membrane protein